MINKQRYEIRNEDLESISRELNEAVASGNYSTFNSQGRKTHVITRDSCSLPVRFLKCFERKLK